MEAEQPEREELTIEVNGHVFGIVFEDGNSAGVRACQRCGKFVDEA
jgi:hypothetical protein